MYHVVIVDDEPVIRFGIKASIEWEKENLRVIGDYANGEEAWHAFANERVDLLITDIKMPVMDGLALTKKALEAFPELKVILVSSYNDFDYVREGLKLGVVDYILKPTLEPEDLLGIIRRCVERLDQESSKAQERDRYHQSERDQQHKRLEQELKRYFVDRQQADPHLAKVMPDWMEQGYAAVYVMLNDIEELEQAYGFLHTSILLEEIQETFYELVDDGAALISAESEMIVIIQSHEEVERGLSLIKSGIEKKMKHGISMGFHVGQGIQSLRDCFEKSYQACQQTFFRGTGGLYSYEPDDEIKAQAEGATEVDFRSRLQQCLTMNEPEQADRILADWKSAWSGLRRPDRIKSEACEMLTILFNHQTDTSVLVEGIHRIQRAETLEKLKNVLDTHIIEYKKLSNLRTDKGSGGSGGSGNRQAIEKALEYIRRNYTEELTLQEVSDYVNISKNYFSILFKKYTNRNFIDFVIHLRVEKARSLLLTTDLRIYEVAEGAGFNDVKYFSKLFKKLAGTSPAEFRELHQANS